MAGLGYQELVIILIIIGIPLLIVLAFAGGGPTYQLNQWAPLSEARIRDHALRWYAAKGWTLQATQPGALVFTRRPAPQTGASIGLFLLGIVPLLIYLLFGGRDQTTTLLTTMRRDGTDLEIIVSSRGSGGQQSAVQFFNSLHDLADPAASAVP